MTIQYETATTLPPEPQFTELIGLLAAVFTNQTPDAIRDDLLAAANYPVLLVQLACSANRIIGCKLGYEREPGLFYSWLGCVDSNFRGQGIAAELMRQQHDWCRAQGYKTVQTKTYNQWRSMLLLNIRSGFAIVETEPGRYGLKIVLEKSL
ncbi:acetyltransferase (GNAT) family protein [Spirosoma oryzae]|uniref:Acetyltransferase (GNAT) family protein n=1 Tax=Spirosoma oryzae TaxID=1469603 RepID=A0A2T0T0U5_9BACT|nr:GNAT family N-acetyltransferase [Spirosoma oryzae]PRY39286.1 acetyltransferase (GNAT) family protein [Spirosoma oryzae]